MRLLIVIVNYRTASLTIDCLRSLAPEIAVARRPARASSSPTTLRRRLGRPHRLTRIHDNGWSAWARLMPLPRNGGFAYGNNEAIRPALAVARARPITSCC